MGKRLIIKGADFSSNAIPSGLYVIYKSNYKGQFTTQTGAGGGGNWGFFPPNAVQAAIRGTEIHAVSFYPAAAGTVNIIKCTGTPNANSVTSIQSFTVTQEDVGNEFVMVLSTPLILTNNEWLGVHAKTDTTGIKYMASSVGYGDGMYYITNANAVKSNGNGDLMLTFYGWGA